VDLSQYGPAARLLHWHRAFHQLHEVDHPPLLISTPAEIEEVGRAATAPVRRGRRQRDWNILADVRVATQVLGLYRSSLHWNERSVRLLAAAMARGQDGARVPEPHEIRRVLGCQTSRAAALQLVALVYDRDIETLRKCLARRSA